jgi:HAE1 family hydrophobic/amphiphilic exporter-1
MLSHFFISRPKFAFVIAIVLALAGAISLNLLPINLYPQIAPPQIKINAVYPGANAEVVEESVLRPLEEKLNGIENMLYIESNANNDGSATIVVSFKQGTDADLALVNTQNRVSSVSRLPEEVTRRGVTVSKQSYSMLLGVTLIADDPNMDRLLLSNYATNWVTEPLGRIPGVGGITVMGQMS